MNKELLEEVRRLKLSGKKDQEILADLQANFSATEIQHALNALRYMRPPDQTETLVTEQKADNIDPRKKGLVFKSRHITLAVFGFMVILLIFNVPFKGHVVKSQDIKKLDDILIDKYDVERSYNVGSITDCTKQGPTRFGEITSIHVCSLITAKAYFPRIKVETQKETNILGAIPETSTYEYVTYINKAGESLERDYIQFGYPIKQPSGANPYHADENLKLTNFDHVVFSGISSVADKGEKAVAGKWSWSEDTSWLGSNSPGSRLKNKIDEKVYSDMPVAKGSPRPSEALKQGRAPLIVYYDLRYCHSPSIIFLDRFCAIPHF